MVESVLYQIRHNGILAEEALDSAMTLAAFERKVTVLLLADGVQLLVPPVNGRLKALPLYDIREIWVERESLAGSGLSESTLPKFIQCVGQDRWPRLASQFDAVLS